MLVFVDRIVGIGILLLIDWLHRLLLLFLCFLLMGVNPRDKKPISIILDILDVWWRRLLVAFILLENFEISHLNLKLLSVGWILISNVVIHFCL